MSLKIASPHQRWAIGLGSAAAGLVLASGFLPTTKALADALTPYLPLPHLDALAFPLLALFFYVSVPGKSPEAPFLTLRQALWTIPFPAAISAVFGFFHQTPSLFHLAHSAEGRRAILWFAVCIPIGEELLFRGWVQSMARRLFGDLRLTETNPFPAAVWISAIAFSLWHTQNAAVDPPGFVAFQVLYTLLTGLWLAYLRWATGKVLPCVLGHFALNVASNLW